MSDPLTFGSLFAGIGGMDLGLERSGLECRWQVEIDGLARRVLAKHWPDVRRHDDVRTFPPDSSGDWHVDVIAGGFPCQDISFAGKGAGLAGERSGLWYEFARIVRDLRPRYVLVENVSALLVRGLDAVLGTLASLGYDAEWSCLSACSLGAPHMRERVFLVAYPHRVRQPLSTWDRAQQHAVVHGPLQDGIAVSHWWTGASPDRRSAPEPELCRVANGVSHQLDEIRGLGNAVVPQVAEFIGRRLIEFHEAIERKGEGR